MKLGVQFNEVGEFVGDFLEGMQLPEGHQLFTGDITEGLYVPKLVDGEVVEGLSAEEIEQIRNTPKEQTTEERLQEQVADLKARLSVAEQVAAEASDTQQALIEILVELGVI